MKMKKILAPRRWLIPLRMSISYPKYLKATLKSCEQSVNIGDGLKMAGHKQDDYQRLF